MVQFTQDLNPRCQPSVMLDDFGKPARAESCLFQHAGSNLAGLLGVPIYVDCRIVVEGVVSHVTGNGGLQDFPSVADVIHWNEGKGLHPLECVVI